MMNDRTIALRVVKSRALLLTMLAAAALTVALFHPGSGNAASARGPVVSTATSGLGRTLVSAQGRTLYLFEKDKAGKSACAGACATAWPPLIASGKPIAGSGVKASLLGTTKRTDGRLQVTYDHRPLYLFVKDTKKGQTSGEGVNAFGALWYAVSPAGVAIVKTTNNGGGGGYGGYR